MTTSTKLGVPYIASQQATPEITHNEALYMLEALLRGVKDRLNVPPGAPADGDTYLITAVATGAWAGWENHIAVYAGNAWRFVPGYDTGGAQIAIGAIHEGMRVYVIDEDAFYQWSGAAWVSQGTGPFVAKAGDTMTGALNINFTGVPAGLLNLITIDNGAVAGGVVMGLQSTSPAVSDLLGYFGAQSQNDALSGLINFGFIQFIARNVTAGAELMRFNFRNRVAGALTDTFRVEAGAYMPTATGGDQGAGTFNAVNYFDDGVNINTIYGALAADPQTWTGQNNFKKRVDVSLNATIPAANATDGFRVIGNDATAIVYAIAGYGGNPNMTLRRAQGTVASPTQITSGLSWGNLGWEGYAATAATFLTPVLINVSALENYATGAIGSALDFNLAPVGSATRARVLRITGGGGLAVGASNTDQGAGTVNASRFYDGGIPINSMTTVNTDAAFSLQIGTSNVYQRHTGTLTANRLVTLSTTGARQGDRFVITRTGAGAFNLDIGGLKNLATNTWAEVVYDGSAWYLSQYGAL